jgi:hypothetical protein
LWAEDFLQVVSTPVMAPVGAVRFRDRRPLNKWGRTLAAMGQMEFKGIDQRTTEARAALKRLRWEIEFAFEQGETIPGTGLDLAEVLAIAVQIGKLVDQHLPAGDPQRIKFEQNLHFQIGFHDVPR